MANEVRARLAARARRFIDRNFSLQQTGEATMQVYRELLDGRGRGRYGASPRRRQERLLSWPLLARAYLFLGRCRRLRR